MDTSSSDPLEASSPRPRPSVGGTGLVVGAALGAMVCWSWVPADVATFPVTHFWGHPARSMGQSNLVLPLEDPEDYVEHRDRVYACDCHVPIANLATTFVAPTLAGTLAGALLGWIVGGLLGRFARGRSGSPAIHQRLHTAAVVALGLVWVLPWVIAELLRVSSKVDVLARDIGMEGVCECQHLVLAYEPWMLAAVVFGAVGGGLLAARPSSRARPSR
jgi:hypothetical protein